MEQRSFPSVCLWHAYGICRDRSVPRNKFNAGAIQLADLTGSSGMLAWARVCP